MIQYAVLFAFYRTPAITGYPLEPVIGRAKGATRWRV
jgi:hypothetical protein